MNVRQMLSCCSLIFRMKVQVAYLLNMSILAVANYGWYAPYLFLILQIKVGVSTIYFYFYKLEEKTSRNLGLLITTLYIAIYIYSLKLALIHNNKLK